MATNQTSYLDDMVAEKEANQLARTEDNVKMSLDVDVEKRLKAEHLAKLTGQPDVEFVERNYDLLDREARIKGLYSSLPENSVTKNILSNPNERALLADAESLAKVESDLSSFSRGLSQGKQTSVSGKEYARLAATGASDSEIDAFEAMQGEGQEYDGFWGSVGGYTGEGIGLLSDMAPGVLESAGAAGAGSFAATRNPLLTGSAAGLGAKFGLAGQMFSVEGGHAFNEFRKIVDDDTGETIPREVAVAGAALVGAVNAALEFTGLEYTVLRSIPIAIKSLSKSGMRKLLKNPAARDALTRIGRDYASGIAVESATEGLQELSVLITGDYLRGSPSKFSNYVERIGESLGAGFYGGVGMGGISAGARSASLGYDTYQQKKIVNAFKALGEDVTQSKLFTNAPAKFKEFIKSVQERHGVVDTIYIESEVAIKYFQDGENIDMVDMPETAKSIVEAQTLSANGYVAIPLEEFVANVAVDPGADVLYQDMTFDIDAPTPRMVESAQADYQAILREYEDMEIDQGDGTLYDTVRSELIAAGRVDSVADPEAEYFTKLITRMAQRQGIDPIQYYKDSGISIVGEIIQEDGIDIPTRVGGMLNVLRSGKGPKQGDVFGETLVEGLIKAGGIMVDSELSARDLDKAQKAYSGRRIATEGGMSLEEAFEFARDNGYLTEREGYSEEQQILDLIDKEIRGDRVYSDQKESTGQRRLYEDLAELERVLAESGIDIDTMENPDIMRALGVMEMNQGDAPLSFLREQYDIDDDQILYQSAFHGTPSLFDKFSMAFMGKGEGAQAYGWGMYFAGNREIAEGYRDTLSGKGKPIEIEFDGKPLDYADDSWNYDVAVEYVIWGEDVIDTMEQLIAEDKDNQYSEHVAAVKWLRENKDKIKKINAGNLYQVDLPEDSELLDYDKPLSEQPESVQKAITLALSSLEPDGFIVNLDGSVEQEATGKLIYEHLSKLNSAGFDGQNDKAASNYLEMIGIPGLRYLDGNSRKGGEETHNYVIWDETRIHIEGVNDKDIAEVFKKEEEEETTLYQDSYSGESDRMSTRQPWGKNAEDTINNVVGVDIDTMAGIPENNQGTQILDENVKRMEDYAGLRPHPDPDATPKERAEYLKDQIVENLLWLHDKMQPALREKAKLWYDGARKVTETWADKYGFTESQVAAVIATLSPEKDWYQNVSGAERMLDIFTEQQAFQPEAKMKRMGKSLYQRQTLAQIKKLPKRQRVIKEAQHRSWTKIKDMKLEDIDNNLEAGMWIRAYDETFNPKGYRMWSPDGNMLDYSRNLDGKEQKFAWGYPNTLGKAVQVMRGDSYANVSNALGKGHKVRNFYNNIIAPMSPHGEITADTHAVAAGLFEPLGGSATEVGHNLGGGSSHGNSGLAGTYAIYADAYREAARQRGLLPREMQSITWEEIRTIFTDVFKTEENELAIKELHGEYKNGTIEAGELREKIYAYATKDREHLAPDWSRPDSVIHGGIGDSTYRRELDSSAVSRRSGSGADTGRNASGRRNGNRGGDKLTELYQSADQTDTPEFQLWSGGAEVIESSDVNDTDFKPDTPYVLKASHGTTHDFTEFDASQRGQKGGHFGAVNYFTTDSGDASQNYGGRGPDLTSRLERRFEEIFESLDEMDTDDLDQFLEENGFEDADAHTTSIKAVAREIAQRELEGDNPKVLDVYIKTEKPFVVGRGDNFFQAIVRDMDAAAQSIADSYGITVEEAREQYEDEIWEEAYSLEESPLYEAIDAVASRYEGVNAGEVYASFADDIAGTEITTSYMEALLRDSESVQQVMDYDNGEMAGPHFIAEIIQELGYDSIILKDANQQFLGMDMGGNTAHIQVFDANNTNIKSVDNKGAFSPDSSNIYEQKGGKKRKPRGSLSFNDSREYFKVTLNGNANLSTFIHESGHLFLELMRKAALGDGVVDQQLLDDYAAIKKFLGVEGDEFTVEQHEKLARAMEQYVREGKAPSAELRGAFQKLKGFMLSVYKYATQLRVNLDPEIQAVFDRALATEEAIASAESDIFANIPSADVIGQDAYNELVRMQALAVQQAEDEIEATVISELKQRKTKAYKNRKSELKKIITEQVSSEPIYVAMSNFRGNPSELVPAELLGKRMSSDEIVSEFGDDRSVLNKHFTRMYGKTNTVPLQVIADTYNLGTPYEMLQAMASAPKKSDVITARVQEQLDAEFGNVLQDTNLNEEAAVAMHNSKLENFILASNRALSKLSGTKPRKSLKSASKNAAQLHVSRLELRNIRPHNYYKAEQKSAKLEAEALAAKDFTAALKHNRERLLNYHLYIESAKALRDAEKIRADLKKVTPKTLQPIRKADAHNGTQYANMIEALLAAVEFKKTSFKQIDARRQLQAYVAAAEANNEQVLIDPALYSGEDKVNYREMTLQQLTELKNSINSLRKMGRDANTILIDGIKMDNAVLVDKMRADAEDNVNVKVEVARLDEDTRLLSRLTRFASAAASTLRKVELLAIAADGGLGGIWHKAIFQPFVDAQRASDKRKVKVSKQLKEIWSTATAKDSKRLDQEVIINGLAIKKLNLYAMVLNMGNQGNLERLFKGLSTRWVGGNQIDVPGWKIKDVGARLREIQEHLTIEDFKRIEAMGKLTDSFYEDMAGASERADGRRPPKVEATPLYLEKYGITLSGWYYPVSYKTSANTPERQQADLKAGNDISMVSSPITGQVSNSMTKERAAGAPGGELDLNMRVFSSHINDVIHYFTHYEAIKTFERLRKSAAFHNMYNEVFSPADYKALRDWVQNIATNGDFDKSVGQASKWWESWVRRARFGTSLGAMAYNLGTGLMQPLGLFTAQDEIGGMLVAKSMLKYTMGAMTGLVPTQNNAFYKAALDASSELRNIDMQMDRDIREYGDTKARFLPKGKAMTLYNIVADNPFILIIEIQKRVNAITFMAAKEKAESLGFQGQDVIDYAESAVRVTQSGGGLKDLSGIQSGNEIGKALTPFYTYFSVLYGRLGKAGRYDLLRGFKKGGSAKDKMYGMHSFAVSMTWLLIVPVLAERMMRSDMDDEDWGEDTLREMAFYPMTTIPVVRDIASAMKGFGFSSPLDRFRTDVSKGVVGAADLAMGEANWTDIRNILKLGTLATGLPFTSGVKIAEALEQDDALDVIQGAIFGVPYKNRPDLLED